MKKNEIIDFCLDHDYLDEEELNKQLANKLQGYKPYDHSDENITKACGLESSKYANNMLLLPPDELKTASKIIEFYEKNLTKRELSFYVYQLMVKVNTLSEMIYKITFEKLMGNG